MKYYWNWIIYSMSNLFMLSLSQYVPSYRQNQGNLCDGNKAALVEHFFTVIFSEFRNPPPVCVCVQMCVDQATYCYPNGCLRKMEIKRKRDDNVNQSEDTQKIQDDKEPMFVVNCDGDQLTKVNDVGTTESPQSNDLTFPLDIEPSYKKSMNIYNFGDNYKKLFKFRKLPKVQLQYNLREQVKNTKSNILTTDVANNRWPLNKVKQVSIGKPYQPDVMYEKGKGNTKYFRATPSITPPKYFKRDLKLPVSDAEYKSDPQASEDPEKFSLEKLINDLIESGLDTSDINNNSDTDMNKLKAIKEEVETNSAMSIDTDLASISSNKENGVLSNVTGENFTDITKSTAGTLNNTIEISNNKSYDYYEDQTSQTRKDMFKNVYNDDLIDTLSKSIEKLNNTSYEMLKMQTIIEDTGNTKVDEYKDKMSLNKTNEVNDAYDNTTSKLITAIPNNV